MLCRKYGVFWRETLSIFSLGGQVNTIAHKVMLASKMTTTLADQYAAFDPPAQAHASLQVPCSHYLHQAQYPGV